MLDIKQESFAVDLGNDWSQKKIFALEQKEVIDDPLLEQIAGLLKVPVAAIKNFDEEAAIVYFNTFSDFKDNAIGITNQNHCTFNSLDKFVEAMEENKNFMNGCCRWKERRVICCKGCWIRKGHTLIIYESCYCKGIFY